MDIHTVYTHVQRVFLACLHDMNDYLETLHSQEDHILKRDALAEDLEVSGSGKSKKERFLVFLGIHGGSTMTRDRIDILSEIDYHDHYIEHLIHQNFQRRKRIKGQLDWLRKTIDTMREHHQEVRVYIANHMKGKSREENIDLLVLTGAEEKMNTLFDNKNMIIAETEALLSYLEREIRRQGDDI